MDPQTLPRAAAAPQPAPTHRTALALRRLQASRLQLGGEMLPASGLDADGAPVRRGRRWARAWRRLQRRISTSPAAAVALHALEGWWKRHPWRVPAEAAAEQAEQVVVPWVRRHPALAMAGAAAAGAGLVLGRRHLAPWVGMHLRGLPGQMLAAGTAVLMHPSVQTLLAGWLARGPEPADDEPPAAAQPP